MSQALYIGLMSGTSLDGIDAVLCDLSAGVAVLAHESIPFDEALRAELAALNSASDASGGGELHRAAVAANSLAMHYAEVVGRLLRSTGLQASAVRAIGAHGQTVRHRPGEFDGVGYTLQINAPALLAQQTGIDVVSDFRAADVAAGGQGAPLAPIIHQALFGRPDQTVGALNVGGISNLTVLRGGQAVLGFDCGPGNGLMDLWAQRWLGLPFDRDGAWAASGRVIDELLDEALREPYFARRPPKSTGRDLFNAQWLDALLNRVPGALASEPADVQATLCELTARSCANDLREYAAEATELVVCGGGAFNRELMRQLAANLPGIGVVSSQQRGLPPLQVEAAAFAWLAHAHVNRLPGNLPAVTGATRARVLGALYPA